MFFDAMELGISTSFNYNLPLRESLAAIARAGFQFVSLGGRQSHSRYHRPEGQREIKALFADSNLRLDSLHCPYDPTCDLTQPEDILLNGAITEMKRTLSAAAELGVPRVIMHLNTAHPMHIAKRIARVADGLAPVVEFAQSVNVTIALENLDPDSEVLFKHALDLIDSQFLMVCYDNGHEMLYNPGCELLKKYGHRLAAIHLHDNDGQKDLHLIPFEGRLDLAMLAGQLNKLARIPDLTMECEMPNSHYSSSEAFLKAAFDQGRRFMGMLKRRR